MARTDLVRSAFFVLLAAVLALLPFETVVVELVAGPVRLNAVEVVSYVALAVWAVLVVVERRAPRIPRAVGVLLLAMVGVSVASAALAGPLVEDAFKFVARSAVYWLLFLAAADAIRDDSRRQALVVVALGAAAVSAAVGIAATWLGQAWLVPGQEFTVGGVPRVRGTFDYPNTGAMVWEATTVAAVGAMAATRGRWQRALLVAGVAVAAAALVLSLSRAAVVGLAAGLAVMAAVAFFARRRPFAMSPVVAGAAVVIAAIAAHLAILPAARLLAESDTRLYGAEYRAPERLVAAPGATVEIPVGVTNTGALTWEDAGANHFSLAYHWLNPLTGEVVAEGSGRWGFGRPIGPDQTANVTAGIVAPQQAGEWLIGWDVVHEGVAWFVDKRVPLGTTHLSVGGGAPPESPAPSISPGPVIGLPEIVPVPERGQLWLAATRMIAERPVLGAGPGTFRLLYGNYLGWADWDRRFHSNNLFLELAATTGIAGLLVTMALIGLVLALQLRSLLAGQPAGSWPVRLGLLGAVVAFLVHGLLDYFFGFTPTAVLFWVFLGLGLGAALESEA